MVFRVLLFCFLSAFVQVAWGEKLVIAPNKGLPEIDFKKVTAAVAASKVTQIGYSDLYILEVRSAKAGELYLKNHPHLKFAKGETAHQPSATFNDPMFSGQWALTKIGVPSAYDLVPTAGAGVTVAVLDSGMDATHPDLAVNYVAGWDFFYNNSNTADTRGHGTAVAGTVAAVTNNGIGMVSPAGWAKIMPLAIVDDTNGWGYDWAMAQALVYAADHGARLANISYEGVASNPTIWNAAQYFKDHGGLVFVAASNTGTDPGWPASDTLIAVSATDANDAATSFSSYGAHVDLAAPGVNMTVTTNGGGYGTTWYGTSFASPLAMGVAAMMMTARPDLSPQAIESILEGTSIDLGDPGKDIHYGWGRVDAAAAVQWAIDYVAPVDTTPPTCGMTGPASPVYGTVSVTVSAADNIGVQHVDLYLNQVLYAFDTTAPYQFSFDTTPYIGTTLTARADVLDAANNLCQTQMSWSVIAKPKPGRGRNK